MSRISDGFQWSYYQQANHVINVVLGSNVSLPCEYLLTPQEQHEANIFHLLTWTREEPFNSETWAGLAIKSTLTGSKVIYDDPQHIFITNNTLQVTNVSVKDHTRYQCSFQSSFFTSPSNIELNVQCEYAITLKFYNHPTLWIALEAPKHLSVASRLRFISDHYYSYNLEWNLTRTYHTRLFNTVFMFPKHRATNLISNHGASHRIAATPFPLYLSFPVFDQCYSSRFLFAESRLSTVLLFTQMSCHRWRNLDQNCI